MRNRIIHALAVLFWIVLFGAFQSPVLLAQANTPTADVPGQELNVYVSENKIIYLTKPVDEVTSSNPDILTVEKVRGGENQISVTGAAVGLSTVTVKMGDVTATYDIRVSPMPQRIYINIPESKYLSFKDRVDDFSMTVPGVIRVQQPSDKELLLEALPRSAAGGRTTLTIFCGKKIYRYYISTFENRGADILEIQNAFATRGYSSLGVKFDNDQATVTGSVATQEELDDAVRIVKQFTPYVMVKAVVGAFAALTDETEEERVIINNIQRIAQVKGLIIKVKFEQPKENSSSTYTKVVGAPALTSSVTDNQTRLTTTNTQLPATNTDDGPINRTPVDGTIETVTVTQDKSVPEKIFLFGELENDLDEAKAIRVARTFCPFVVSMITVKDPIQLRLRTRLLTVDLNKLKNTGVNWYSTDTASYPTVGGGLSYQLSNRPDQMQNLVMTMQTNVKYALQLGEKNDFVHEIQEMDLLLTNGQASSIFRGEEIPYPATRTIDASGAITTSAAYVSVGLYMLVVPLNFERSSQQPGGSLSLISNDGSPLIPNLSKYYQLNRSIGNQPAAPLIDESLKYVDENGLIGLNIITQISAFEKFVDLGGGSQAPQTNNKRSMARAQLREGQSVVIGGLMDDNIQKTIKSVPGFNKIPIFGFLFDATNKTRATSELMLVLTPEIVRMKDGDSKRLPKPALPEMQDLMQQEKLVPTMKPVRYDARGVDLRPDIMTLPRSIETMAPEKPASAPEPARMPVVDTPAPPHAAEVTKEPVSDTADAAQPAPIISTSTMPSESTVETPTPAASAAAQPNVDTAAPTVNNPPPNPSDTPPTLP